MLERFGAGASLARRSGLVACLPSALVSHFDGWTDPSVKASVGLAGAPALPTFYQTDSRESLQTASFLPWNI
jgi:hypothetical protein